MGYETYIGAYLVVNYRKKVSTVYEVHCPTHLNRTYNLQQEFCDLCGSKLDKDAKQVEENECIWETLPQMHEKFHTVNIDDISNNAYVLRSNRYGGLPTCVNDPDGRATEITYEMITVCKDNFYKNHEEDLKTFPVPYEIKFGVIVGWD